LVDYLEYNGRIDRFFLELVIVAGVTSFLASVVNPITIPTSAELAAQTPLDNDLGDRKVLAYQDLLEGYFVAHNKGMLFHSSFCEYLEFQRTFSDPRVICARIAGANLAATDGDVVNATKAIEYAKANLFKILSADASVCPTPPGCFDG